MSATQVPLHPIAKGSVFKLWLGVFALVGTAYALAHVATAPMQHEVTESGLKFRVLEEGEGDLIAIDDGVYVLYRGRLTNGQIFDESGPEPASLLVENMIPGFREALLKMREGGRYWIMIPSELAYGDQSNDRIPANSDLEFDIEVKGVARGIGLLIKQQQMQQLQGLPPQE